MRNLVLLHIFSGVSDFSHVLQEVISAKLLTGKLSASLEAAEIKPELCCRAKKNQALLNIISLLKLLKMRQTTTSTKRVLPRSNGGCKVDVFSF